MLFLVNIFFRVTGKTDARTPEISTFHVELMQMMGQSGLLQLLFLRMRIMQKYPADTTWNGLDIWR
jgi:hypothetical protein